MQSEAERYFEEMRRERNAAAWSDMAKSIGTVESTALSLETLMPEKQADDRGISEEQANNDFVWPAFSSQFAQMMHDDANAG